MTELKHQVTLPSVRRHFSFEITETDELQRISPEKKRRYLLELRINVFRILSVQGSGMDSDTLEKKLHENLNTLWTYSVFNCSKFHLFMLKFLKDIVEVEMKHSENADFMYIFYLKNSKFKKPQNDLSFDKRAVSLNQAPRAALALESGEKNRSMQPKKMSERSHGWSGRDRHKDSGHFNILENFDPICEQNSFMKRKEIGGELERPNNSFTYLSGINYYRPEDNVSDSAYNDLGWGGASNRSAPHRGRPEAEVDFGSRQLFADDS